jgi:hypothetical protein
MSSLRLERQGEITDDNLDLAEQLWHLRKEGCKQSPAGDDPGFGADQDRAIAACQGTRSVWPVQYRYELFTGRCTALIRTHDFHVATALARCSDSF